MFMKMECSAPWSIFYRIKQLGTNLFGPESPFENQRNCYGNTIYPTTKHTTQNIQSPKQDEPYPLGQRLQQEKFLVGCQNDGVSYNLFQPYCSSLLFNCKYAAFEVYLLLILLYTKPIEKRKLSINYNRKSYLCASTIKYYKKVALMRLVYVFESRSFVLQCCTNIHNCLCLWIQHYTEIILIQPYHTHQYGVPSSFYFLLSMVTIFCTDTHGVLINI